MSEADAPDLIREHDSDDSRVEPVMTLGDLLKSDVVGMWRDRDDLGDSVEFARKLRDEAWRSE